MDENGYPLHSFATPIDENDRIHVHILVDTNQSFEGAPAKLSRRYDVKFEESKLARLVPPTGHGDPFSPTAGSQPPASVAPPPAPPKLIAVNPVMVEFTGGPFDANMTLKVTVPSTDGAEPKTVTREYPLQVHDLYSFSAKLGVLYSDLADQSFGLQTPPGTTQTRVFKTDEGQKAELAFMVVPYVWSRQGRDLLETPSNPLHRLNPIVGLSISEKIGQNYYAGLAYEISPGVDLTVGKHFERVERLSAGVTEGMALTGAIPTRKEWANEVFVGVTFPSSVFNQVFKGIFKGKIP